MGSQASSRPRNALRCLGASLLALLATSWPAASAAEPISGKLSQPGYTVIALAANGKAVDTHVAGSGAFSIVPPSDSVSLHLRAADGTYAGPVVLEPAENFELKRAEEQARRAKAKARVARRRVRSAKRRLAAATRELRQASGERALQRAKRERAGASRKLKRAKRRLRRARRALASANEILQAAQREDAARPNRAILGVKAGAQLGDMAVNTAAGYAKVAAIDELSWETRVDTGRVARATGGVPIGAGNFGYTLSTVPAHPVPGDLDADGIPDPLDVDDDGDRVLDNLDLSAAAGARTAQVVGCGPNNFYCAVVSAGLALGSMVKTVNVNAGSTLAEIDDALMNQGALRFSPASDTAELDCGGEAPDPDDGVGWVGGLSWCSRGGTGIAIGGGPGSGDPFPGPAGTQFDTDGDGYGTFPKPSFLQPRATSAQISTGQPLAQRITNDGVETLALTSLNFVFVTIPALVSYSDAAGNSATVSYPVTPGDAGTMGNGFPVSAPAGQDVVVTLTLWPPQRIPIQPDANGAGGDPCLADTPPCEWIDIGQLRYSAYAPTAGHPALAGGCPQETFSTTDPNLAAPELPLLGTGSLQDQRADQPTSPANTLTYSLNLSQCLAANGLSFGPGEEWPISFMVVAGSTDTAEQENVFFRRQ